MTATGAACGCTAAARRSGRRRYCLATTISTFADKAASRHQAFDIRTVAVVAGGLIAAQNQALKIFIAFFTMVFVYWHILVP
jgi:hypothetical protein